MHGSNTGNRFCVLAFGQLLALLNVARHKATSNKLVAAEGNIYKCTRRTRLGGARRFLFGPNPHACSVCNFS
jgi:hypothetical protein